MELDRRDFLASAAVLGGAGCLGPLPQDDGKPASRPAAGPPFHLSLAEWSLHRALGRGAPATMTNLDFPRVAAKLGFTAIEYVSVFFKDKATDAKYLRGLDQAAADHGVRQLLIMCDHEGDLGDPDAKRRTTAVENHRRWIEAGKRLRCHSIRVNARSAGAADEQRKLVADGLRRLAEIGKQHEVHVLVENHGGLSSNGKWLAAVMRTVDHPHCGTLPDFGNFTIAEGEVYDRYQGVAELMPWAKAVSAKSNEFDADGNEVHTDYRRMMKIVLAAGYRGFVGVEYEGSKLAEEAGIAATRDLLLRVRDELALQR